MNSWIVVVDVAGMVHKVPAILGIGIAIGGGTCGVLWSAFPKEVSIVIQQGGGIRY